MLESFTKYIFNFWLRTDVLHKDRHTFCPYLEHKALNIFQNKKYFKQKLVEKNHT
jgi:hypothetical protein